jgi:hypothetical protein
MADSAILGLFTTPEQYQIAQQQAQEAQAIQYANLSPMARANYGTFRAGQQLGGVIGGALGGQDPQLKLISQRQQLASQLDPSRPESFMQAAELAAKSGDQQFAIVLANAGREANIKVAQANKERQLAVPSKIQEAQMIPQIEDAINQYKALPASPERDRAIRILESQLNVLNPKKVEATPARIQEAERNARSKGFTVGTPEFEQAVSTYLERPEKAPTRIPVGVDREAYAAEMFDDKTYAELTAEQKKLVNDRVDKEQNTRAKASAIMLPNQPVEPKDWIKFSEFINKDPLMNRTSTIISDAPTAIETIRNSTENNFSAASLPAAIAKLTGEGKNMSNTDIERYTRIGGLDQRIAGDVVKFFTGKKTDATKAEAEQFAVSLYRGALLERKKFIEDQAESTGYNESPNYKKTIEQLDKKLAQFKLVTPSSDADKEKRYQEFKAKELAKQSGATR